MKSIFSGDYASNIRRINQDNPLNSGPVKSGGGEGDEFSALLSALEKRTGKVDLKQVNQPLNEQLLKATSDVGRSTVKANEPNFTPAAPDLTALVTHFSIPASPDGPPLCPMANWSKGEGSSIVGRVKKIAPEQIPGTRGVRQYENVRDTPSLKAPGAPVLKSASRYHGEHVVNSMAFSGDAIRNVIETAGKFHGIDPSLSMAIATAESSLRPDAVSRDGFKSKGLFQLLDTTGREMQTRMGNNDKYDPFDPALNAHLGVGYLRYLHDIFSAETNLGSNLRTVPVRSADQLEKLAVAAFNAGQGNVAQAQARAKLAGKDPTTYDGIKAYLPASTREYVARVTNLRNEMTPGNGSTELA